MAHKVIIDNISKEDWEQCASHFADYNIYQTWAYQETRSKMDNQDVSRIVVKNDNGSVETMGQVRIKHVKTLGLRIGYFQWGPLVRGTNGTLRCSAKALNLLCGAYLGTRVNVLRVVPGVCHDEAGQEFARLLEASGFHHIASAKPYHTMFLSLNCPEDVLRKNLRQSWRRKLKKAEGVGIEIRECTDEASLVILGKLYQEMARRKKIKGLDPRVFIRTQHMLSDAEKMNVVVANYDGEPVTAHLTSNLRGIGILLLVASSKKGLACGASYLAWWKAITLSNRLGMKEYDVGGIDFEDNPTVSRFKAGMGGDDRFHIGTFEAYSNAAVRNIWLTAEKIYRTFKKWLCLNG